MKKDNSFNKNFEQFFGSIFDEYNVFGQATCDDGNKSFFFAPDDPRPGMTSNYRTFGYGQLQSDGTFEFVAKKRPKTQSVLLKKVAHGRLSATADGAIQLTLKVFKRECLDVKSVIINEANEAFAV